MMDNRKPFTAAKANTARAKNGIIHTMSNCAKTTIILTLAIVGGIAVGMRCDASEWVDNLSQFNPHPAAYTVKTYTGPNPFVPFLK